MHCLPLHRRLLLAFAAVALPALAHAAPYVPSDDAQVLERLPERSTAQYRQVKALQTVLARSPNDLARATALAAADIRIARDEGDPRYLGYAQSALAPWWKNPDAPTEVLVLRATIRQSLHDFDAALADLDRVLAREPGNAQAVVTRATVLTVVGRYGDARVDCARLSSLAPDIYATACTAAIDSLTGNARGAMQALDRSLAKLPRNDVAGRAWGETLRAEIAGRLDDASADAHFRAALAADERDLYLRGAYSDWLLDARRPADVLALTAKESRVDPLLLRLALAQRDLREPAAGQTVAALRARFDASRARGDAVHRREEARFALWLDRDPRRALVLARDNWKVQREPADLRILAEAAAATDDADTLAMVRQWLSATGLEYPAVARLVRPQ